MGQARRTANEYRLVEPCNEPFQQIGEPSPVAAVETLERLDHRGDEGR